MLPNPAMLAALDTSALERLAEQCENGPGSKAQRLSEFSER